MIWVCQSSVSDAMPQNLKTPRSFVVQIIPDSATLHPSCHAKTVALFADTAFEPVDHPSRKFRPVVET